MPSLYVLYLSSKYSLVLAISFLGLVVGLVNVVQKLTDILHSPHLGFFLKVLFLQSEAISTILCGWVSVPSLRGVTKKEDIDPIA